MRKHTVAIIGLGMAVQPHALSLRDLETAGQVEVRLVMSRTQQRLEAFRKHFSWPGTTSIKDILQDAAIDTVIVLTPPATHLEIGKACLEAGKHVLIEKPIAIDTPSAEELVQIAKQARRHLGVVLQHRFRTLSRHLMDIIGKGQLGSLCAATCQVPWWRNQNYYDEPGRGTLARDGGGVLMTQAIHTLDLFRHLTGGLKVQASLAETTALHQIPCEDFAAALLRTSNNSPAIFTATTAAYPGFSERIEWIGTKATARLTDTSLQIFYQDGRQEQMSAPERNIQRDDPMDFPYDAHHALIQNFLESIDARQSCLTNAEDALETHYLIDAIVHQAQ